MSCIIGFLRKCEHFPFTVYDIFEHATATCMILINHLIHLAMFFLGPELCFFLGLVGFTKKANKKTPIPTRKISLKRPTVVRQLDNVLGGDDGALDTRRPALL